MIIQDVTESLGWNRFNKRFPDNGLYENISVTAKTIQTIAGDGVPGDDDRFSFRLNTKAYGRMNRAMICRRRCDLDFPILIHHALFHLLDQNLGAGL